jgi:hypothetical protein
VSVSSVVGICLSSTSHFHRWTIPIQDPSSNLFSLYVTFIPLLSPFCCTIFALKHYWILRIPYSCMYACHSHFFEVPSSEGFHVIFRLTKPLSMTHVTQFGNNIALPVPFVVNKSYSSPCPWSPLCFRWCLLNAASL